MINDLLAGKVSAYDLPPIQVVQKDGLLFSIDNRRLLAFNSAGIDKIPVEIVSLKDPAILTKFRDRFMPINNEGHYAVVVNAKDRANALDLLRKHNFIRGNSYGY